MRPSPEHTNWLPVRLRRAHPVLAATGVAGMCYLILLVVLSGAGFVVTHLLIHSVGRWDDQVNAWFVRQRTATGNRVTGDFTLVANAPGILGMAVVIGLLAALWGRARLVVLVMVGLVIEFAAFLSTNYIVARPRPHVPHLGSTPSTFSWPSGHVAAVFVVYGGAALIVTCSTRRLLPRVLVSCVAVAMTGCVAVSRIYRGDHHPTDAMAGLVLGMGALCAASLACRAWTISASYRAAESLPARPSPTRPDRQPLGLA